MKIRAALFLVIVAVLVGILPVPAAKPTSIPIWSVLYHLNAIDLLGDSYLTKDAAIARANQVAPDPHQWAFVLPSLLRGVPGEDRGAFGRGRAEGAVDLPSPGSTVVLPAQTRQGVFESPTVTVNAGVNTLDFQATGIPTAEYENPANSLQMKLFVSPDGVQPFIVLGSFTWTGGHYVNPKTGIVNPPPYFSLPILNYIGQQMKIQITIPNPLTVGATVVAS
jgi:hypothetical protein